MRMKRWESPRREGRNHKGKKKSARQRQIKKQTQLWRKKLKGEDPGPPNSSHPNRKQSQDCFFYGEIGCRSLMRDRSQADTVSPPTSVGDYSHF